MVFLVWKISVGFTKDEANKFLWNVKPVLYCYGINRELYIPCHRIT